MRPFDLFASKVEIQPRIFQRWNSYSLNLIFNLTPATANKSPLLREALDVLFVLIKAVTQVVRRFRKVISV